MRGIDRSLHDLQLSAQKAVAVLHSVLTERALMILYAHAQRRYPEECCGIVFGPRKSTAAMRVVCGRNMQNHMHALDPLRYLWKAERAYCLSGRALATLEKSLPGRMPAKIVYHSHTKGEAQFSLADQEGALSDGEPRFPVEYVVIDARVRGAYSARQYAWDRKWRRYVEVITYASLFC